MVVNFVNEWKINYVREIFVMCILKFFLKRWRFCYIFDLDFYLDLFGVLIFNVDLMFLSNVVLFLLFVF